MFDIFGNSTTVPPARWVNEPNRRGTWSILSDCLLTLVLCLWTALHLNVPSPNRHRKRAIPKASTMRLSSWLQYPFVQAMRYLSREWRKTCWLVGGLLAPEVIAFTAIVQRHEAAKLTKAMKKVVYGGEAASQKASSSSDSGCAEAGPAPRPRRHPWTLTHSYYAISGGFVFDTRKAPHPFLSDDMHQLTLTPKGIIALAEYDPDMLPDMSEEEIMDKSKANGFAKLLACIQAFWFCTQCITRVAQNLAISLLELNVFAHALCTLVVYAMWWSKPLDVEHPTTLSGEREWDMCAAMCMQSTRRKLTEFPRGVLYGDEYVMEGFFKPRDHDDWIQNQEAFLHWCPPNPNKHQNPVEDLHARTIKPGESLFGFQLIVSAGNKSVSPSIDLSQSRVHCWQRCSRALARYCPTLCDKVHYPDGTLFTTVYQARAFERTVYDASPNWPTDKFYGAEDEDWQFSSIVGLAAASFIYGGLHLLAWNVQFASVAESILWKYSSIAVCSTLALITAIFTISTESNYHITLPEVIDDAVTTIFLIMGVAFALSYLLARTYLVVECFMQLARLPPSAFQTPQWSQYVPHLG